MPVFCQDVKKCQIQCDYKVNVSENTVLQKHIKKMILLNLYVILFK